MLHRYQRFTPRLLPAGAIVAGWVIFLLLDQRALSTAHDFCGLGNLAVQVGKSGSCKVDSKEAHVIGEAAGYTRPLDLRDDLDKQFGRRKVYSLAHGRKQTLSTVVLAVCGLDLE